MLDSITRNWWVLALRGAFAILFGIMAWVWPGITVWALVVLFGAYALVDGVMALYGAVRGVPGRHRAWLALTGAAGVVLGVVALSWPGITALALLVLIAAWAVVTGVLEIVAAFSLRGEMTGEWMYALTGAVSILFGVLLFAWPAEGVLTLVWLVGFFSVLFGAMMVGAAFRLRRLGRELGGGTVRGVGGGIGREAGA